MPLPSCDTITYTCMYILIVVIFSIICLNVERNKTVKKLLLLSLITVIYRNYKCKLLLVSKI